MEDLVVDSRFWKGKRVFVTGHTGFKGSWLCLWLESMGAEVFGFALVPPTTPSLFEEAGLASLLAAHTIGDVRDADALGTALRDASPHIVFHMAAQSLVRPSYEQPVETYSVNVMGTVNVLEAARQLGSVEALINITTDKCYENREWLWGYRECEPLGGRDPYSNSKACSELVTFAYRSSFHESGGPWIASARAGNVIGGGDWAMDRLLPDAFRALDAGTTLSVRYPNATRPWQHVLEPLSGYIALAQRLSGDGSTFAKAWNFGPGDGDARPVRWILGRLSGICPELKWQTDGLQTVHEAYHLKLDSAQAHVELGWRPRWPLAVALEKSAGWHQAWRGGYDTATICRNQIADYLGTVV